MEDDVSDTTAEKSEHRSMDDILTYLVATRQRLAESIAQLKQEARPDVLKAKARTAVLSVVIDPETGLVRTERIAAVVGVTVGLILLRKGIKARSRKRQLRRLGEVVWVPVPRAAVKPELMSISREAIELAPAPTTTG